MNTQYYQNLVEFIVALKLNNTYSLLYIYTISNKAHMVHGQTPKNLLYKYITKVEMAPRQYTHNCLASCELSCLQQSVGGISTLGESDLVLHVIVPRLSFGFVHCTELDTFHNLLSKESGSLFFIMRGVDSAHAY